MEVQGIEAVVDVSIAEKVQVDQQQFESSLISAIKGHAVSETREDIHESSGLVEECVGEESEQPEIAESTLPKYKENKDEASELMILPYTLNLGGNQLPEQVTTALSATSKGTSVSPTIESEGTVSDLIAIPEEIVVQNAVEEKIRPANQSQLAEVSLGMNASLREQSDGLESIRHVRDGTVTFFQTDLNVQEKEPTALLVDEMPVEMPAEKSEFGDIVKGVMRPTEDVVTEEKNNGVDQNKLRNKQSISREVDFVEMEQVEGELFQVAEPSVEVKPTLPLEAEPVVTNNNLDITTEPVPSAVGQSLTTSKATDQPLLAQKMSQTPSPEVVKDFQDQNMPRLAETLTQLGKSGQEVFKLTLQPEKLGQLEILVKFEEGKISAKFLVGSEGVRELVETCLPLLEQNLAKQQIVVNKVDVALQNTNSNTFDFNGHFEQQQHAHQQRGKSIRQSSHYEAKQLEVVNDLADRVDILV
ncbi:flagellar hook-length control protein FliK [Vagococcus sp. BWB3-3]|uniref:Flagellar hook-length control protein FliK n=1 Tax=Vagococcus allomyrinae TaxID=2794353 RepID=A0A940SVN2_9ENTE|nr:flagellar hook-length control protein FliK [Vagococcus allomyrinae]MBP1042044.1 flagellar hook-length control protein FliK [Vagococcus allomyrinae]